MKRMFLLLLLAGCGSDSAVLTGLWAITSVTPDDTGDTINTSDTVITDQQTQVDHTWRVNGTLDLREDGVFGVGSAREKDGAITFSVGNIANYTATAEAIISDGSVAFTWSLDGNVLTIVETADVITLVPLSPTVSDSLAVAGNITVVPAGVFTPFVGDARVALLFYLPGFQQGEIRFIIDPRDDILLTNFGTDGAQTATFDLSRTEGALGIQRVTYDNAFFAVGIVVVYDDVNQDGTLNQFLDGCQNPGDDCVRGFSPLALAYRTGSSQMLADSPFGFLLEGWTHAGIGEDIRTTSRTAVVSLDPTPAPMAANVEISASSTSPALPQIEMER